MTEPRYYRKVIRVCAEDSPNVKLALEQRRRGLRVTGEVLVPGVLTWDEYLYREATWDDVRKCVGLRARFWEGADALLFPPDWLDHSERKARESGDKRRVAKAMGVDPGEGDAETAWAIVDEIGLIQLIHCKTPNTAEIKCRTAALIREYNLDPQKVALDRGGGGKQIADEMREGVDVRGYGRRSFNVRTVAFGETVAPDIRQGMSRLADRVDDREERSLYVNRRAQMYWELRAVMDPAGETGGFAIPARFGELRRQLAPIPLLTDPEGRRRMLPKDKRSPNSTERCLREMIGRSPDHADALVLAVHMLLHTPRRSVAGAAL